MADKKAFLSDVASGENPLGIVTKNANGSFTADTVGIGRQDWAWGGSRDGAFGPYGYDEAAYGMAAQPATPRRTWPSAPC